MTSILLRMAVGIAGAITRSDSLTVQPEIPDASTPPTVYGGVVKLVSGKLKPIAASDAATVITGILVRPYPVQSATNAYGAATPPASNTVDVLKRGYVAVKLAQGTSAKDGVAYVRITAATGKAVGDIETGADSGNCIALPAKFMGPADASGITEIAYNI